MHFIDILIFVLYMVTMLGVGFYFLRKNANADDYYVGGRNISSWHVGLSVVATDVGGGFSIGLGGLGFTMGIAGSWMLFTGLLGAWLAAVFLIPKVSKLTNEINLFTFPEVFKHIFDARVAIIAGVISAIGYLGFTSSQILAGAKLASATFTGLDINTALIIMGSIAVVYTVMGGLKAVIYTDTIQWIILMSGLIFIGIPLSYIAIGGYEAVAATVKPELLSLQNVSWQTIVNWGITIIPIWFVGMTLYQRIYACRTEKDAKKAWFIAGFFEWPIMAFMGVLLGLFSRVALDQGMFVSEGYATLADIDSEMGLPLLLRNVLPIGLMGLMMSAYFSAIMSTADSCLMAASGNIVTDILQRDNADESMHQKNLRFSQWLTLGIGTAAILIATLAENVLSLMLYSYAFMVSGLFVPLIAGFYFKNIKPGAAIAAMISGGTITLVFTLVDWQLPFGLDPNFYGISSSILILIIVNKILAK